MVLVNFVTFVVLKILENLFAIKRMFFVSYKMVFIKNEAVLLYGTMWECARGFAATI